jgi:hypothetical protein
MKQSWKKVIRNSVFSVSVAALAFSAGAGTISASTRATHLLSTNKTSIAFGDVTLEHSSSHQVILTNRGNTAVRISQIRVSGKEFKASGLALPFTLAAGRNAALEVMFAPTKAGSAVGSVEVISNATNSPIKTAASGKGVPLEIIALPGSVNFGDVTVGVANTQTVTLSNQSSEYIKVTHVAANGTGLSLNGLNLPLRIAPRHTSAFTLRFAPLRAGKVTGSIAVVSDATNSLLAVGVTGTGEAPTLKLSANPSSLSFGEVHVGTTSTKIVTLSNTGNAKISVSGIQASGTGFGATGYALPFTLAAGQSATFQVEFAPKSSGNSTGDVRVKSTASATPDSIPLSGSGTTHTTPHSVVLTWVPSSSTVVGYHIYRGEQTSGPFARLSPSVIAGTTYTDTTAQSNTNYFYVATAVNAAGIESGFSNEISVKVP